MTRTEEEFASAYAETAAKTVTEGPMLLVALYDRLAHDVEVAKQFIAADDVEASNDALQHAQKIVIVLRSSLQEDGFRGGHDLMRLYNTLLDLLVTANLNKNVVVLEQCQGIIAPLHEAWSEAVAASSKRLSVSTQGPWSNYLDALEEYLATVPDTITSGRAAHPSRRLASRPVGPVPPEFSVRAQLLLAESARLLALATRRREDLSP